MDILKRILAFALVIFQIAEIFEICIFKDPEFMKLMYAFIIIISHIHDSKYRSRCSNRCRIIVKYYAANQ